MSEIMRWNDSIIRMNFFLRDVSKFTMDRMGGGLVKKNTPETTDTWRRSEHNNRNMTIKTKIISPGNLCDSNKVANELTVKKINYKQE